MTAGFICIMITIYQDHGSLQHPHRSAFRDETLWLNGAYWGLLGFKGKSRLFCIYFGKDRSQPEDEERINAKRELFCIYFGKDQSRTAKPKHFSGRNPIPNLEYHNQQPLLSIIPPKDLIQKQGIFHYPECVFIILSHMVSYQNTRAHLSL